MNKIRYLLDENTTRVIAEQLLRRQPDMHILVVGDELAPPRGTLDPDILFWLECEGYCLLTYNRNSMPQHLHDHLEAGHHVPGIFILKQKTPIGKLIEDLLLIWEASYPEEYQDMIVHLPF